MFSGSYRINKIIGRGSFGIVYQAYQSFLDRYVAIKTLHSDFGPDTRNEQRFMNEARTIAQLRHPNIVSAYEFGTLPTSTNSDDPQTYMVMEYLPGNTLQARLRDGVLPIQDVITMLEQLAGALDYAHARGIIHRDLKPANILFSDTDQPVIVDFGLAQLVQTGRGSITDVEASTISGTLAYMAPEQLANEKTSGYTDQYALAVITYELLTQTRLFDQLNTATQIVTHIDSSQVTLIVNLPPKYAKAEPVLARALSVNPESRFETAAAFANALADALLPDYKPKRTVFVSDPTQVAVIHAVRQTISGVLWGISAIVLLLLVAGILFFIRGYVNGDIRGYVKSNATFVNSGVLYKYDRATTMYIVAGLWPGNAGGPADFQFGDQFNVDIFHYTNDDYTVNGKSRALMPGNWLPSLGDVIQLTVLRSGQPVVIRYTIVRDSITLVWLIVSMTPALLAFVGAVWLLRRWGPEPGVRVIFILLLGTCMWLLAFLLASNAQSLAFVPGCIVLPSITLFILSFPEPLPILTRNRRLIWLLYAPLIGPLIEFVIGTPISLPFAGLHLGGLAYLVFGILILPALYVKWIRRDLKRYPDLRWLIGAFLIVPVITIIASAVELLNWPTIRATFGSAVGPELINDAIYFVGATAVVALVWFGFQQVQMQIGPSYLMRDKPIDAGAMPDPVAQLALSNADPKQRPKEE